MSDPKITNHTHSVSARAKAKTKAKTKDAKKAIRGEAKTHGSRLKEAAMEASKKKRFQTSNAVLEMARTKLTLPKSMPDVIYIYHGPEFLKYNREYNSGGKQEKKDSNIK